MLKANLPQSASASERRGEKRVKIQLAVQWRRWRATLLLLVVVRFLGLELVGAGHAEQVLHQTLHTPHQQRNAEEGEIEETERRIATDRGWRGERRPSGDGGRAEAVGVRYAECDEAEGAEEDSA
jgi:hypothetical protein